MTYGIRNLLAVGLSFMAMTVTYAGIPLWSFTPLTETTFTLPSTATATVEYRVTNQSTESHRLVMSPLPGISQVTTAGYCANPFFLAPNQSCILRLTITGSGLTGNQVGGPAVCEQGGCSLQCYQPSLVYGLNITKGPPGTYLTISVTDLALSVKDPVLNAALTGNPRQITITNTGSVTATNLSISPLTWPFGTSSTTTCGSSLAPSASCTITVTPGNTATSDGINPCSTNGTAPVPTVVTVSSPEAAASVSANVVVLSYGCIYQGGYLFSVDDTTSSALSIGGKVAATTDDSGGLWSVTPAVTGANSITDGQSNTGTIQGLSQPLNYPAAASCYTKLDQGYSDWYLPAICEEAYTSVSGSNLLCGNRSLPLIQNMASNLADLGIGGLSNGNQYWSSTEDSSVPLTGAWWQFYGVNPSQHNQSSADKTNSAPVRCVRQLT